MIMIPCFILFSLAMNQSQARKKKNGDPPAPPPSINKIISIPKTKRQDIDNIYPFPLENEADIPPELHQHALEQEKQFLTLNTILNNNREKYEQLFLNLAAKMDEKGVSASEIAEILSKVRHFPSN